MCGICGIMRWDGRPVSAATVRAMTDALTHRGPDGEGLFIWPNGAGGKTMAARSVGASPTVKQSFSGISPEDTSSRFAARAPTFNVSVGLGNRRLAVIDPEGGRQPVSNLQLSGIASVARSGRPSIQEPERHGGDCSPVRAGRVAMR